MQSFALEGYKYSLLGPNSVVCTFIALYFMQSKSVLQFPGRLHLHACGLQHVPSAPHTNSTVPPLQPGNSTAVRHSYTMPISFTSFGQNACVNRTLFCPIA